MAEHDGRAPERVHRSVQFRHPVFLPPVHRVLFVEFFFDTAHRQRPVRLLRHHRQHQRVAFLFTADQLCGSQGLSRRQKDHQPMCRQLRLTRNARVPAVLHPDDHMPVPPDHFRRGEVIVVFVDARQEQRDREERE